MKTFKEFLHDKNKLLEYLNQNIEISDVYVLNEYNVYHRIPKTNNSCRFDSGDTGKSTQDHAHIYSQQHGKGKELYSINIDGTGHDGSSGKQIPKKHAKFLKSKGYTIPDDLKIESYSHIDLITESAILGESVKLIILIDPPQ